MKNILRFRNFNFQNLAFFGLLLLAYQNYETRNKLSEISARIEYSFFELDEIKKEVAETKKYAKSANTMAFSIFSDLDKKNEN